MDGKLAMIPTWEAHQTSDLGFNNTTSGMIDPLGFEHIFFYTKLFRLAAQTLHIPVRHNLPTRGNFSALLWKLLQHHCYTAATMTFTAGSVFVFFLRFNFSPTTLFLTIYYHPLIALLFFFG